MQPTHNDRFFVDFQERYDFLYKELHSVLDRLTDDVLDWSPAPHMNSIAILMMHLIGAEQYWVGHVATGEATERVRAQEFEAQALTIADLREHLLASQQYVHACLQKLTVEDLAQERTVERFGDRPFTVAWSLLHALEHSATHVGHIHMMLDVWKLGQQDAV